MHTPNQPLALDISSPTSTHQCARSLADPPLWCLLSDVSSVFMFVDPVLWDWTPEPCFDLHIRGSHPDNQARPCNPQSTLLMSNL
jgi:hypothetical protein